jgi:chemotaxis response regulator CheB
VLRGISAGFRLPILIVQHIGPDLLAPFARQLDQEVALPVRVAVEGPLAPGAWLAPPAHLTLDRLQRLVLDRDTRPSLHRPSVDALFESMADSLGSGAAGIVLTGMGRDGAQGVAAITAAGGLVIAQDEKSSVIFGMPRAAAEQGAQLVLPLVEISPVLCRLAAGRRAA